MSEPIFLFKNDEGMKEASAAAQRTFKYFWRELSWERRRIVPALDTAIIKLPFTDGPRTDGRGEVETMWLNDVDFNGLVLSGTLVNAPNWLTSVKKGDFITADFSYLADWMMMSRGKAYGGYTVNQMRSHMNPGQRAAHDKAWGLDFGDPSETRIELHGNKQPASSGFADHPMCVNMLPEIDEQLQADPSIATTADERGWTMLHSESLAGNLGVVKLLVKYGADAAAQTPEGWNAAGLAQSIGWDEIASYLSNPGGAE